MATTSYGVNSPEAVKLWSKKLFYEALDQTYAKKFFGKTSNSLLQIQEDPQKGAGDRVRVTLRMQLTGSGVLGDNTQEGNEEALVTYTDDLLIDQLRHAVRSGGKMSEQRVPFSVREEARMALQDWWADRIDTAFFNQLAGNTAQTDTRYTGSNSTIAPDSAHIIYPDDDTTEDQVSAGGASSIMKLTWIDWAVETAQAADVPIRPIMIDGEEKYVLFMHPYQATDLRTNTSSGQWLDIQKAAMQGGQISKNPIYTGALGEYNGVILHVSNRIPLAPSTTTVRRAVFAGAQAGILAFGQDGGPNKMSWNEELFDYGNQLGVSAGSIWGLKKTRFNSADFATLVIPTYAVAHN